MKRSVALALSAGLLTAVLSMASPAGAHHVESSPDPCRGVAYVIAGQNLGGPHGIINVADTIYIDDRNYYNYRQGGHGIWVYAETNGEPGLQRGGTIPGGLDADICQESSNPDQLLF